MFTGIVERTVRVIGVADGPKFVRLTLPDFWGDVKDGDSVAVNGVCLTVAERPSAGELSFDVVQETLDKTNLRLIQAGEEVHVERSLRAGDRIDGHFVQGHVDGIALIVEQIANQKEWRIRCHAPPDLAKYLVPKGSVWKRVRGGPDSDHRQPHGAGATIRRLAAQPGGGRHQQNCRLVA
jgi:riboflavin synthase